MNNLRVGQRVMLAEEFAFACPFCQKRVAYAKLAGTDHHTVSHALPMCATYRVLDGTEYLEECLREICRYEPN